MIESFLLVVALWPTEVCQSIQVKGTVYTGQRLKDMGFWWLEWGYFRDLVIDKHDKSSVKRKRENSRGDAETDLRELNSAYKGQ